MCCDIHNYINIQYLPILYIQLHSREFFSVTVNFLNKLPYLIYLFFTIFQLFFKVLHQTQNSFLFLKIYHFLRHLVLVIYTGSCEYNGNLCKKCVRIMYIQKKLCLKLLVFISVLFVHLFLHGR